MKNISYFALAFLALLLMSIVLFFAFNEQFLFVLDFAKKILDFIFGYIENLPLWAYPIACFLLPIFILPITPVYFAAGASNANIFLVIFLCYIGVVLNMAISYFLSRKFAMFIREILIKRGVELHQFSETSDGDFIFLIRMIPGNPLCIQNYILGLSGVNFKKYMIISMLVQAFHVSGYIYFSEGILRGDFASFIFGTSLICVLIAAARIFKRKKEYGFSKIK